MNNIDKVLDAFISGDYFIIFLILTLAILIVLILALIKSRGEYNELLSLEEEREKKEETKEEIEIDHDSLLSELEDLMATTKEDEIDEDKPIIKQIDVNNIKTYNNKVSEYELEDEENAVISAEELEKRKKERMDTLGTNDNQVAIAKYEEEQEKKAIISYEQLLKNASNITLSYKEEKVDKDAPKVNKIELEQKEVSKPENYLEEEEFLKILKEFRISLNENIFD